MALRGKKVQKRMVDLKILVRPAMRRTEIFVRPDNSADWYHQGVVNPGMSDGRVISAASARNQALAFMCWP